jgi:hypothetical protein
MAAFNQKEYLYEYFNSLTDIQKIELLIQLFEELQIQEFVSCPHPDWDAVDRTPYWAHTGVPLI